MIVLFVPGPVQLALSSSHSSLQNSQVKAVVLSSSAAADWPAPLSGLQGLFRGCCWWCRSQRTNTCSYANNALSKTNVYVCVCVCVFVCMHVCMHAICNNCNKCTVLLAVEFFLLSTTAPASGPLFITALIIARASPA
ncbi:hypothetical protein FN846DRAFT_545850 [Sphaerosporella brunnea]|uniref:Uncharacterized protein n=1 Tax=Sphaerosporella brunnea TaxID=1250544 RepID=A0A5J5ED90_9PEZI|nr:hypothetical protein FN846DRAFT_545850 [Sphaerosporella brunnea]